MDTVPNNFLGLDDKYSRYGDARFAVLPVPYDSTASYQPGARNGPAAIIAASQHLEWFDEELETECYKCGVTTLDPVEPDMSGPEKVHKDLLKVARRIVRDGKFVLGLGGEHSISAALVQAVMPKYRDLSVLQIDAHCDLRNRYRGSQYSHACVMRRILDLGVGVVPVGIRAVDLEDHRFMKRSGIMPITARDCHADDDWVDRALDALTDTVYVTVDIDGFDPSFAPGTGTPEPGGLDWYQITSLLRLVAAEKRVVGADIVEVAPIPGQVVTEYLAARLAYKIIAYVWYGAQP
jgi:agmatinase